MGGHFMQRFWRGVMAVLLASAAVVPATAGELAPTGTLRATFLAANPVQGTVDPATGEVRGPAADLGRELARRLGVSFSIRQ